MYILYVQWEPKKSGKVRRLLDLWLIMSKEHETHTGKAIVQ